MKDTIGAVKFQDPYLTAKGEPRAEVALTNPETLWFNTGTLCNIACESCYIESSPTNDALVYLTTQDVRDYLDQLDQRNWNAREIGFTGGEPFMNPAMIEMMRLSLTRGYDVLVLTNAMRPMMRKSVLSGLSELIETYRDKLTFRISLDHWSEDFHEKERGKGSFEVTLKGMRWLRDAGARMSVAGRTMWDEPESAARRGYAALYAAENFKIDAQDPANTVLFPEMDAQAEVPEITTDCWSILDVAPSSVMCSSSRMVVKRKGAAKPAVVACTLLPYDPQFELGTTLEDAEATVKLNHPHCSKFCVLGGASCSA
ncbi:MAG: radical SAM protein [Silicimonas sp.]|nr:radical SAM protein [Silicimonas sp.]